VQAAPPAPIDRVHPFILGAFGKERRTLEEDGSVIGTFCDPMIGIKGGVQYQLSPHFMLAPAVGIGINLDEGDRTVLFAELEANYTFANGGYLGTGIGVWDFGHSDNVTPHLLVHLGVPVVRYADERARLLFAVESRLFFDNFDDIENNYQFWAGLRYVFR
jgi:hypothetical protein